MTKLDISKTGSLDSIIDKYKTLLILLNLMMLKGQIVFVDFKKAFDSLEWIFILTTLKHFGFNEPFLIWVKTLYSNIQTCVMNNGWISEILKNPRGKRQGFPLSALLFVLSVEIMALRIRNNKDFQIKIDEQTHSIKISQLADDTTLYFNSKNDISVAMNEIKFWYFFRFNDK